MSNIILTDPWTGFVEFYIIINSVQLNLSIVMSTVKFINEITKSIFSVRTLSTENRSTSGVSTQTGAHGKIEMCAISNYIRCRHSFYAR